ncbi:hypothetical protein FB451DRAFT_1492377 [Mycena latifolia]|nr:hypothetical protein FB451DRAFT_1492377 [Mycena latifolia]
MDAKLKTSTYSRCKIRAATARAARLLPRARVTSAFCLPNLFRVREEPVHKAQLLLGRARAAALFVFGRGRPRINVPLLMSYTEHPRPPALGAPGAEGETAPWLAIVQNALHRKDAHVKVVHALYYAQRFGRTRSGRGDGRGARSAPRSLRRANSQRHACAGRRASGTRQPCPYAASASAACPSFTCVVITRV